jgi:glutathione S-transferase
MIDLYFHHYVTSPFAEKIRLIFGLKGLTWHSVLQPSIMPKPDLQALTGGYRRIPILQIGNEIVCDTTLIADVLEHLAPAPSLFPNGCEGAARVVAQWADSTVFAAAMAYNFQPAGAAELFAGQSSETGALFAADRKAMRGGGARLASEDAEGFFRSYLLRMNQMLKGQAFMFGAEPSIADFSCYHALWFTRRLKSVASILNDYSDILPWMDRLAALGHGAEVTSDTASSLALSRAAGASGQSSLPAVLQAFLNPKEHVDTHRLAVGQRVGITAESFGLEVSEGELLGACASHYTIGRVDQVAGKVRVHFPRVGFILKAVT